MFMLVHMCLWLCLVHLPWAEMLQTNIALVNGTVSVSVFPWWHRHIQSLQYMFIALINIFRHQMLSKCTSKSPPLPLHLFCQEFKLITSCLLTPLLSLYWLELISKLTWLDFNHIYDKLQEVIQNLGSVSEVSIFKFEHCLWILLYVLSLFCLNASDTRLKNLHMFPLHSVFVARYLFYFFFSFHFILHW